MRNYERITMLIASEILVLIMIIGFLLQNSVLIIQSYLIKSTNSLVWWLLSSLMSLVGYVVLSLVRIKDSGDFIFFGAILVFLLCDLIRLYGVEKEFNRSRYTYKEKVAKSLSIFFFVIGMLYVSIIGYTIFVRELHHIAIVMMYLFKVFTALFGLSLLGTYRHRGLKMSKLLLTMVYFILFVLNSIIAYQLYNMTSSPLVFGNQKALVYSTELVIGLLWTLTILTLNVNQVEVSRDNSQLKYEKLFSINPDIQVIVREKGLIIMAVNDSFAEKTGYLAEEVVGKPLVSLPFFKSLAKGYSSSTDFKRDAFNKNLEVHLELENQTMIGLLSLNRFEINDESLLISSFKDISDLSEFQRRNRVLTEVIKQNPVAVVLTDLDAQIIFVNEKFTQLTGYTLEEVLGKKTSLLKSGKYDDKFYQELWSTINSGKEWRSEMINKRKDGVLYWERNIIMPIKDEDDQILSFLSMKEDMTQTKMVQQNLKKRALFDGLTGIYNYGYFMERFSEIMNTQWSANQKNAYLIFDIDNFKAVNDTHGHTFANDVLKKIAKSLGGLLRQNDVYGRVGGEEFSVLIVDTDVERSLIIANRIRNTIAQEEYINDQGKVVNITVSIGVYVFDSTDTIDTILKKADAALYQSKNSGKNLVTVA